MEQNIYKEYLVKAGIKIVFTNPKDHPKGICAKDIEVTALRYGFERNRPVMSQYPQENNDMDKPITFW